MQKREIENLTPEEIKKQLYDAGILPGSSWKGYTRAKAIIVGGQWLDDSQAYSRIIAVICDYLGI